MSTQTKIFKKNAIFGGQNDGIGQKMMNLFQSPTRWPISNRKALQICANLNSGAKKKKKKKKEHRMKNFRKNAISEGEMMEFCRKMMNILNSLAHWSISHQKVAQIKQAPKWKLKKNAILEAKMMEFGRKTMIPLWSLTR